MNQRDDFYDDTPSFLQDLFQDVWKLEPHYFAVGEFSDVYRCELVKSEREVVAVKAIRGIALDERVHRKFEKRLMPLVRQWKDMDHPNIMQCYGVCKQFGPVPALVFPLCENGPILRYIKAEPSANPLYLILQVAAGVSYLHSRGFVHADIRGSNILIASDGRPVLMDGGLSTIIARSADFTTPGVCGPCRWMAPEVLDPPDDLIEDIDHLFTMPGDVYSLGMTILEVFTGVAPYAHRIYDTVVIFDVIRGIQPPRPELHIMSDQIWDVLQSCWQFAPHCRPSVFLVENWLNVAFSTEMYG